MGKNDISVKRCFCLQYPLVVQPIMPILYNIYSDVFVGINHRGFYGHQKQARNSKYVGNTHHRPHAGSIWQCRHSQGPQAGAPGHPREEFLLAATTTQDGITGGLMSKLTEALDALEFKKPKAHERPGDELDIAEIGKALSAGYLDESLEDLEFISGECEGVWGDKQMIAMSQCGKWIRQLVAEVERLSTQSVPQQALKNKGEDDES